jgi:hypothetical protein
MNTWVGRDMRVTKIVTPKIRLVFKRDTLFLKEFLNPNQLRSGISSGLIFFFSATAGGNGLFSGTP